MINVYSVLYFQLLHLQHYKTGLIPGGIWPKHADTHGWNTSWLLFIVYQTLFAAHKSTSTELRKSMIGL
jgi:hypothetical protein